MKHSFCEEFKKKIVMGLLQLLLLCNLAYAENFANPDSFKTYDCLSPGLNINNFKNVFMAVNRPAGSAAFADRLADSSLYAVNPLLASYLTNANDYNFFDLVKEGYEFGIREEIDEEMGILRVKVEIFQHGERVNGKELSFLVFFEFKTIVVENFYPEFTEGKNNRNRQNKNGKGRALLSYLLSIPEFEDYEIISVAEEPFQKSVLKMPVYQPMADIEGVTVYERISKQRLDSMGSAKAANPALEKLQEIWFQTTIYAKIPKAEAILNTSNVTDQAI
ncbi:MAG: hypothetical protein HY810_00285 [Candidatus Omnitrophica bacterium]|nr:hypothetical protein [Candidatus Omnitrophota bacterium]